MCNFYFTDKCGNPADDVFLSVGLDREFRTEEVLEDDVCVYMPSYDASETNEMLLTAIDIDSSNFEVEVFKR